MIDGIRWKEFIGVWVEWRRIGCWNGDWRAKKGWKPKQTNINKWKKKGKCRDGSQSNKHRGGGRKVSNTKSWTQATSQEQIGSLNPPWYILAELHTMKHYRQEHILKLPFETQVCNYFWGVQGEMMFSRSHFGRVRQREQTQTDVSWYFVPFVYNSAKRRAPSRLALKCGAA